MTQFTSEGTSRDRFDQGLKVRKEVLGDEYVTRSLNGASPFRRPMQELTTEYCWGAVWSRPGLPRNTRSLLNIGMMTALNRPEELAIHIRGARVNGCTPEEIQEALLQAAIYCGVPAGMDAFKVADAALDKFEAEQAPGLRSDV